MTFGSEENSRINAPRTKTWEDVAQTGRDIANGVAETLLEVTSNSQLPSAKQLLLRHEKNKG